MLIQSIIAKELKRPSGDIWALATISLTTLDHSKKSACLLVYKEY